MHIKDLILESWEFGEIGTSKNNIELLALLLYGYVSLVSPSGNLLSIRLI